MSPAGRDANVAIDVLLRKFRARDSLNDQEERVLRDSVSELRSHRAGSLIVRADVPVRESILLVEGFVCRFKELEDGRRQILEIHVPGDFLDLHAFLLGELEHNVCALTDARLAIVPHDALRRVTEQHPHLTRVLWFSTLVDAAVLRQQVLSIGRRDALSRIAHLLCELDARLDVVGLTDGDRFRLPLTQVDLADATGLTPVHVNRMLKKLRDDGVATFRGGEVLVRDRASLQRLAEFDPGYLYLGRRPL